MNSHLENSKQLMLYGGSAFLGIFLFSWGIGSLINTDYVLLAVSGYLITPLLALLAYDYKSKDASTKLLLIAYFLNGFAFVYGLFLYGIEFSRRKIRD